MNYLCKDPIEFEVKQQLLVAQGKVNWVGEPRVRVLYSSYPKLLVEGDDRFYYINRPSNSQLLKHGIAPPLTGIRLLEKALEL